MTEPVVVIERDEEIVTLRINRPEAHNALNAEVLRALGASVTDIAVDGRTRAIIVTGTGRKAFSAGADLRELAGLDAEAAHRVLGAGQEILRRIEQSPIPVIAAVNGLALGGGFELILACSFAVVSSAAALGLPEAGLGLIPGYGGTQRLARVVGAPVARHVMLTGTRIDAERAYQLGLAVLPPADPDELMTVAQQVGRSISARGPKACAAILQATNRAMDVPLETGLAFETAMAALAVGGAESTEGVAAFLEKRPARFGGLL